MEAIKGGMRVNSMGGFEDGQEGKKGLAREYAWEAVKGVSKLTAAC